MSEKQSKETKARKVPSMDGPVLKPPPGGELCGELAQPMAECESDCITQEERAPCSPCGSCQVLCQTTCQIYCQSTCQKSCQTGCQVSCTSTCQVSCQTACELSCQVGCEVDCMDGCQMTCEFSCEVGCQDYCETHCQVGCTTCQSSCQLSCQTTCQQSCQSTCQLDCQDYCEDNCTSTCQMSCQNPCEYSCVYSCEVGCQEYCETHCQGCLVTCTVGCEVSCTTGCEVSCTTGCEVSCMDICELECTDRCEATCTVGCEVECQGCLGTCQTTCELNCQATCELNCQTTCELNCQTTCELNCQTTCELNCQTTCELNCQEICEIGCTACLYVCLDCEVGCLDLCEVQCQQCLVTCQACEGSLLADFQPPVPDDHIYQGTVRVPEFTPVGGKLLHYSNYPEILIPLALGDSNYGGKYLNRVDITPGDGEVRGFASYRNVTGKLIGFAWRFRNAGTSAVNLTVKRKGFASRAYDGDEGNWIAVSIEPWRQYWDRDLAQEIEIPAGADYWIRWDSCVYDNWFFCGVCLVETDGPISMYAYAYEDFANIDSAATRYLWINDPKPVYSGRGDTHIISADLTDPPVDVEALPIHFDFADCNYGPTRVDMVPITDLGDVSDPGDDICFVCGDPTDPELYRNIGNWGVSYRYRVSFVNHTSEPVDIAGFIGSQGGSSVYVHICAQDWDGQDVNDGTLLNAGYMWRFVNISVPPGGDAHHLEFTVTKGTNSSGLIRCCFVKASEVVN